MSLHINRPSSTRYVAILTADYYEPVQIVELVKK